MTSVSETELMCSREHGGLHAATANYRIPRSEIVQIRREVGREKKQLAGAAIGAAAGAGIGAVVDTRTAQSSAIGAVVGALGGILVGFIAGNMISHRGVIVYQRQ
jgi:uncharacterized protein YcfJ